MLNPFFLQGSKTEQSLIQSLINEQLQIYGVEIFYIPRRYITEKTVIKEVIQSVFDNAYPLEAYVNTYDGYEGQGTILSKFGIQSLNNLTITISKERFELYISPLLQNSSDIKLSTRPKEGDLIYFPLGDRLFEIKFVEHEKPFYQLQQTYVYELNCELFRYEDEIVDTGVREIDDNITEEQAYVQSLIMVGSGSTATAETVILNGGVRLITVTNRGNGYTSIPRVAISSAPNNGSTAVGISTFIGGLIDCNGNSENYKVQGVQIINPGYGYTVAPSIVFVGGGGKGAKATSILGDGIIGVVTVTSGGFGYETAPSVTFTPAPETGITATGISSINSAGIVTAIYITNAGLGYTQIPDVTISPPYSISTGTYVYNETVTGTISSTTAVVKSWDIVNSILQVSNITGSFVVGDILVGEESGATHKVRIVEEYNLSDNYAENDIIEIESNGIIDFNESNPFGNP
jgi:hypothetical protein